MKFVTFPDVSFETAMDAGEETVAKARQYSEVLPAEEFVSHIGSSLTYISQRQNRWTELSNIWFNITIFRHNELASVKRLEQQQHLQLMTTYGDCDQAIKWLGELKETLHKEYSLSDIDEDAVKNLRNDRQNLDRTAVVCYCNKILEKQSGKKSIRAGLNEYFKDI